MLRYFILILVICILYVCAAIPRFFLARGDAADETGGEAAVCNLATANLPGEGSGRHSSPQASGLRTLRAASSGDSQARKSALKRPQKALWPPPTTLGNTAHELPLETAANTQLNGRTNIRSAALANLTNPPIVEAPSASKAVKFSSKARKRTINAAEVISDREVNTRA